MRRIRHNTHKGQRPTQKPPLDLFWTLETKHQEHLSSVGNRRLASTTNSGLPLCAAYVYTARHRRPPDQPAEP